MSVPVGVVGAGHPQYAALAEGTTALGLALAPSQIEGLLKYLGLLAQWNRAYNLTAVRDAPAMLTHHLLDSLSVIAPLCRHTGGAPVRLLDVGSGGGLPGVVIAICCPEIAVTCIDAVAKKTAFVRQVAGQLGLANLSALHARVESVRERFEVVTARAFAALVDFTHVTRQALTEDGVWMAMKGRVPTDEMAVLPESVRVFHVEPLQVPGLGAERCLVWMRPVPPG